MIGGPGAMVAPETMLAPGVALVCADGMSVESSSYQVRPGEGGTSYRFFCETGKDDQPEEMTGEIMGTNAAVFAGAGLLVLGPIFYLLFALSARRRERYRQQLVAQAQQAPGAMHIVATPAPVPPPTDRIAQLERLASLRDRGALTDAEYEAEKARILASG